MSFQDFNDLAGSLSSLATIVALVVGGIWTYQRFVRTREAFPKIEFTVDIVFVHKQAGYWVVEVVAHVENKGLVRHEITQFTFDLRHTLASDPIQEGSGFLVNIPHKASEGSWLPASWPYTFIEPGLHTRYSCVARIPENASMALLHGKFFYKNGDEHTAEKLVAVPAG